MDLKKWRGYCLKNKFMKNFLIYTVIVLLAVSFIRYGSGGFAQQEQLETAYGQSYSRSPDR